MTKFLALLRTAFLSMMKAFSFGSGKNKKKAISGIGALAFMAGLSVYISGVYSGLLASVLQPAGLLYLLPMLMGVLCAAMAFLFTAFAAGGLIFGGRDSDLVLALPVSAFEVLLSKVLALYLENLVITLFMLLPMAVAYCIANAAADFRFIGMTLVSSLFMALLPTLLALVVGYFVTWFSSRFEKKNYLATIVYFLFFGAIMYASFQLQTYLNALIANADRVERAMNGPLLVFGLLGRACGGELLALLELAALTLLPFLLVVWIFSRSYKRIITRVGSHAARSDYKLTRVAATSRRRALLRKESERFFGTTIYIFNTSFGLVMMLLGTVIAAVKRESLLAGLGQMFGAEARLADAYPIVLVAMVFMLSTVCTSSVSLSLEGKSFWVLREAPLSAQDILFTKGGFNLLLTLPVTLVCSVALSLIFGFSFVQALLMLFVCVAMSAFVSFFGVEINLRFPRLDAENDTIVVKQSLAAMLGVFGGMIVTGALALLYVFVLRPVLSFELFCLLGIVLLLALTGLLLWELAKTGERRLRAL